MVIVFYDVHYSSVFHNYDRSSFLQQYVFSIFVGRWVIYILNLRESFFSYAFYYKLLCYLFGISLIALSFIAGPVHK